MKHVLLFLTVTLISTSFAGAQQRASIGFWNVENLHDTIPSDFYDDTDYTPDGKWKWGAERYATKLSNLAKVIDDAGFDVAGLCEVESEMAVRDLVMVLSDDYNYIHRTLSDRRGMDVALLYKGDKFYPGHVGLVRSATTREFLLVRGQLLGEPVNLLVCHLPSKSNRVSYRAGALERLAQVADSLMKAHPAEGLVVMGDLNCTPHEKIFRNTFGKASHQTFDRILMLRGIDTESSPVAGSYAYDGEWMLNDNIMLSLNFSSGALRFLKGGIFVKRYMLVGDVQTASYPSLARRRGYPHRTITSGLYTAGFSDHLPVYVILEKQGL